MRGVLERHDVVPVVVVAHDADESDDSTCRAVGGVEDESLVMFLRDRLIGDLGQDDRRHR